MVLITIQKRLVRFLKKMGLLEEKQVGVFHLGDFLDEPTVEDLCSAASVQHRLALGERAGQKVRKLGGFGERGESPIRDGPLCFSIGGFSLHANVAVEKKEELERLCRYVARPPIAESRLYELSDGNIVYRFKKPWSDGTEAVLFSPTELIEKLMAMIPQPRIHLTRFHGVLAPNSRLRAQVVPEPNLSTEEQQLDLPEIKKRRSPHRLTWSELLKRVFKIDVSICPDCGGKLTFIATILDPKVIHSILSAKSISSDRPKFAQARAPPQGGFAFV